MEDVIGGQCRDEHFAAFLADWERILERRVGEASDAFSAVKGVRGLILAGGVGRGAPWPLSDIDILPIYEENDAAAARLEVERRRVALLQPWMAEGWWSGLDIGKLAFERAEVARLIGGADPKPLSLLADDRWYHALDKGFGGRAIHDLDGLAGALGAWFTTHRFHPEVVQFRLQREQREIASAQRQLHACIARQDLAGGVTAVRSAVKWVQTWLLERWGERDNSQGRLGARFASLAHAHGQGDLVEELDALSDLDDASVARRLEEAPDWVHERHERSLRARRWVGEDVTPIQDARDTLRVCSLYATKQVTLPPYPAWLAIPTATAPLSAKAQALHRLFGAMSTESP